MYFFLGFVIMTQVGGRILDRRGARPAVIGGSALAAVGFFLLAGKLTDLSLGSQSLYVILAGGGLGLMLGVASTDAVNRAPKTSYSEVTGITQTARNFGASIGLAVLGTVLISRNDTTVTHTLTKSGVPGRWRTGSPRRSRPRRRAPSHEAGSRTSSCTMSRWRSRDPPRPSSTSWPP
jgi:MFS family permease